MKQAQRTSVWIVERFIGGIWLAVVIVTRKEASTFTNYGPLWRVRRYARLDPKAKKGRP